MCGKDFPKRMALRNHEQYQHGVTITADALQILPDPPALAHCTQGAVQSVGGGNGPLGQVASSGGVAGGGDNGGNGSRVR